MLERNIVNLRNLIKHSGLEQKQIARIIRVNPIHLNKVLNGKSVLTMKLANKLSKISIFHTNEHDLLYPDCQKLPQITFEDSFLIVKNRN